MKAVIGFYGVYDMQAQWHHNQITRPRDQITREIPRRIAYGADRRTYFDASPLSYATFESDEKTRTRFLADLRHQRRHRRSADPSSQAFLTALKQARFFVRTIVVPGSGHFWASDPIEEPGSYGGQAAPQMLRFLPEAGSDDEAFCAVRRSATRSNFTGMARRRRGATRAT